MKPDNKTGGPWLYALGLIPAVWLALLIAPSISGGLSEILEALPAAMNDPFQIVWCEDSVKTVLTLLYFEWVLHHRSELLNQSGQSIL